MCQGETTGKCELDQDLARDFLEEESGIQECKLADSVYGPGYANDVAGQL